MAKKKHGFLKFLVVSAAAAGTYYYLKKKNSDIPENMDDEDDIDNFDEDVDDGPVAKSAGKRNYVNLDFNTVEQKAKDAAAKVAETAEKAAATIGEKLQSAAGRVEEFFDDRKAAEETEAEEEILDAEEPETEEEYSEDNE